MNFIEIIGVFQFCILIDIQIRRHIEYAALAVGKLKRKAKIGERFDGNNIDQHDDHLLTNRIGLSSKNSATILLVAALTKHSQLAPAHCFTREKSAGLNVLFEGGRLKVAAAFGIFRLGKLRLLPRGRTKLNTRNVICDLQI